MEKTLFLISGLAVNGVDLAIAAAAVAFLLLTALVFGGVRAARERREASEAADMRQRELDRRMMELQGVNAELAGRVRSMADVLSTRQTDLARLVGERLDSVGFRVGQGLESSTKTTTENLQKLNERLAVIDAAQSRLTGLTEEVLSLKDILANKQSRGAFGQGRMEAIVRDGLPTSAYDFQVTLSNRTRPDCVIRLPGDERVMVVDAKFPLESLVALKEAADDDERKIAAARVRSDVGKHIKDISERYFIPGETQDLAVLFVPSESVYADISEHFEDVIQKAHRARIIMVSPSLLMMAIQVMQAIVRDANVRAQAHLIQVEVRKLLEDVTRLRERTSKLENHFRQAQEDVVQIGTSADKIRQRGNRIDQLEFPENATASVPLVTRAAE